MTLSDITTLKSYFTVTVSYRIYINFGDGKAAGIIRVREDEFEDFVNEFGLSVVREVLALENGDRSITYRIYLDELYRS